MNTKTISQMNEIMKPAMAVPRGVLNKPMKLNSAPRNQIIHPRMGIQPRQSPRMAKTNPVVPMLLDFFSEATFT